MNMTHELAVFGHCRRQCWEVNHDETAPSVKNSPYLPPRISSGFTLLELLVTMSLVAVLAVLTVGALRHMKKSSQSVACTANLRRVGLAMLQYTQDHENRLPGPLWRGQSPYAQADAEGKPDTASGNLVSFLADYLEITPGPGGSTLANVACPAWVSTEEKKGNFICYYSMGVFERPDGSEILPFGRLSDDPENVISPLTMAALDIPAQIPALREFDRGCVSEGAYTTDSRVPDAPVHQTLRHVLFFDNHVAAVSVQ